MTATTATRPPIEAEIRKVLADALDASRVDFAESVYKLFSAVNYYPPDPDMDEPELSGVWSNLRHSETNRLRELLSQATDDLPERFERETIEALVAACMKFAEEYPDAPRAER